MTTTEPFLHQVHLHPSDTNNNVSREEEDMAMDEEDAEEDEKDLGGSRWPLPMVAASTVAVNFDMSLISDGEGGG